MGNARGDSVATGGIREKWLGGFVRYTRAGKPTFIIERHWRGGYYKASTRCHTEAAALKELARFEEDPGSYIAGGRGPLRMTAELILEHQAWQLGERGNTYDWAKDCANMLRDWLRALGDNHDLRRLKANEVKEALLTFKGGRPARVVALKGFYSWLRKEKGLLEHREDPMPDVRITKKQSSRLSAPKDVPRERAALVYRHLREDVRDVLQLLAGTGWHMSEAIRFAHNGEIRKDPTGKSLATLIVWHKAKEKAISGITKRSHLEAAKRIRAKGYSLGRSRLHFLISRACEEAGLPREEWFGFGAMRHSVSTWAIEAGEDIEQTAKALNHTSAKMLRGHYVRHAVPRALIKTHVLK